MTAHKNEISPAIILVNPQMGENIGAAARAMLNFGLTDLRLVNPRDGWPSASATANAAGALEKMPPVPVYTKTATALEECHYIYATTARRRGMIKPVFTPSTATEDMHERRAAGQNIAVLFGAERSGLDNDDIALSHAIITVPVNPDFSSLNLGQSVLLLAYEWHRQKEQAPVPQAIREESEKNTPVSHAHLLELFERLETELEAHHFFRTGGHKPIMIRNLRNLLTRAEMTDQEARTFHGIISALTGKKTL